MRLRLRFTPRAARELEEQYTWYQLQRPGLGDEYLANASVTFETIQENPYMYPRVRPRIRRASMDRLPYGGVFYTASPEAVTVVALIHGRRHPRTWPRAPR